MRAAQKGLGAAGLDRLKDEARQRAAAGIAVENQRVLVRLQVSLSLALACRVASSSYYEYY